MPVRAPAWWLASSRLLLLLASLATAMHARADEPPAPGPASPSAPAAPSGAASSPWSTETRDLRIPMRDGATLAANVLRPKLAGRYPAIVVQTPYDKNRMGRELGDVRAGGEAGRGSTYAWERFDREHYVYVFVDWRGFHGSTAAQADVDRRTWRRGQDGYDVVEWTAAQTWCDGKVGTWGGSALGKQQFDTAAEQPPHLLCAVPLIAFMGQRYASFFEGGVRLESHTQTLDKLGFGVSQHVLASPLPSAPAWAWARRLTYHPERIDVPCLFVSGWWDHYPREVLETFADVVAQGGPRARAETRLVMGPWSHTAVDLPEQGDLAFPAAAGYSTALTMRFFDRFLRGVTAGWDEVPRVHLFQTGEERWVTGARVADLLGTPTTLALAADGTLAPALPSTMPSSVPPAVSEARPMRTYRYDPRNPTPTVGGRNLPPLTYGPKELSALSARTDVLVWSSKVLEQGWALCGEAEARLRLACDRPDVDISVRLCDQAPDGRLFLVGETIQRASLRAGGPLQPLTPGTEFELRLRLPPHAWTWAAGHKLVVLITSGNWPRYERNPHTGAARWDEATAHDVNVTLFLGPGDATLTLPLLDR